MSRLEKFRSAIKFPQETLPTVAVLTDSLPKLPGLPPRGHRSVDSVDWQAPAESVAWQQGQLAAELNGIGRRLRQVLNEASVGPENLLVRTIAEGVGLVATLRTMLDHEGIDVVPARLEVCRAAGERFGFDTRCLGRLFGGLPASGTAVAASTSIFELLQLAEQVARFAMRREAPARSQVCA